MYKVGRMTEDQWDAECREIDAQRARLTAAPAPLFAQQQSVLTTLVDEWDGMSVDQRKRMLTAIFDIVTATAEGVDRLEPCEDWRPYVVAAIPKPVEVRPVPAERKTGLVRIKPPSLTLTADCHIHTLRRGA